MERRSQLRRSPLAPMSPKRARELAEAGIPALSTFAGGRASFAPVAAKPVRRKPALPAKQVRTLKDRSGGQCEITMTGCTGRAVDPSHRIGTKSGGRHGEAEIRHARLSNVLHACRSCHNWLHSNPGASKSEGVGWALEEWQEPTQWPVLYRGELSYLTDFGDVVPYEDGCP